jgi:hypothetical protein
MQTFSERNGFSIPDAEIKTRNDAPDDLRDALISICYKAGFKPSEIRAILCDAFFKAPNQNNWSDYPNIDGEIRDLIHECKWFEVYDAVEMLSRFLRKSARISSEGIPASDFFDEKVSRYFRRAGIGWQVANGKVEMRGSEAFEHAVRQGRDELWRSGKQTAATELHEAIQDLSRRPVPELTGAIQHAMAALECVARDKALTKDTLGALIQKNPGLFPKPIDSVVEKCWGWTSNNGRHLIEGGAPSFEEAELVVGISGVLCRYLSRKI